MKKILSVLIVSLISLVLSVAEGYRPSPTYAAAPTEVALYSKYESTLNIQATFTNPFNPDDVRVTVHVTTPSGNTILQPAFWYQAYTGPNGNPLGNPEWRWRFTPSEIGTYSYIVQVIDRNGTQTLSPQSFTCYSSHLPGFVRLSSINPHYFSIEPQGATFYPLGHNVSWNTPDPLTVYTTYFSKMAQNGENFTRLDIGIYSWAELENEYYPIGTYDLKNAYNLDYILNQANLNGIYTNLTLEWSSYLISDQQAWLSHNPYNSTRGGPITNPWEFWTNPEAKRLFKQRLYYLIARYSYSPNIILWETINEVSSTSQYSNHIADIRNWSQEMFAYLHQIDPYHHLVSQSYPMGLGDSVLNKDVNFDVVQTHSYYNYKDYAQTFSALSQGFVSLYAKPNLIGEFSLDASGPNLAIADPQAIHLSTAIWGAFFGGASGSPQSWYWKDYINTQNHYEKFKGLANYLTGVDLAHHHYLPFNPTISSPSAQLRVKDVRLQGILEGWNNNTMTESLVPQTITVTRDGYIQNAGLLNQRLFGYINNPVTFNVDYPTDSQFSLTLTEANGNPTMKIYLDGILKLTQNPATLATYSISVPKGTHQIKVTCGPGNWIMPEYHFYLATRSPTLEAYGLIDSSQTQTGNLTALVWIKNENYNNYYLVTQGQTLTTITNTHLNLSNLPDGAYRLEWWDTKTGQVISQATYSSQSGILITPLPPITQDIALKIYTTTATPDYTNYQNFLLHFTNIFDFNYLIGQIFK